MSTAKRVQGMESCIFYFNEDGQLHREDGPAAIYTSGMTVWYCTGKEHRTGGKPTYTFATGETSRVEQGIGMD